MRRGPHVRVGCSTRFGSDPNRLSCDASVTTTNSVFQNSKIKTKVVEARGSNSRNAIATCRVESRRASGGGGGVRERLSYSHSLTSATTLHLIRWCATPPTFHVGLNFPLPPLAHTHGPLKISGFCLLGYPIWAQYSNIPPPDLKCPFEDLPILATCLYTSVSADIVKLNLRLEP